jgi:nucleoside-diphosphate kinase
MERTLIIFKPDAVQRGIVGEILARFERAGLKIAGMKMVQPDETFMHVHYEDIGKIKSRRGDAVYENNLKLMQSGPVIAAVLEGIEAVDLVRKMVGLTEPSSAAPGTVRGDYAHMSYRHGDEHGVAIPNLIHASGDAADAKLEVPHWFAESELYEYQTVHEQFTQPKKK